jgi:hypothetical protein
MRLSSMHFQYSWIWFGWGRCMVRDMDAMIYVVLFPELSQHTFGRMVKGWHFEVAWNWRPIVYRYVGSEHQPWAGIYDSKLWTGRDRIIDWCWPSIWRFQRVN